MIQTMPNQGSGGEAGSPSEWDEIFDVLSDPIRRQVALYINQSETATIDELARVAAESCCIDERIARVRLIHCHLPKMADVDVVDYDPRMGEVESQNVEPLVESLKALGID